MGASSPIETIRNLKQYVLIEKLGEGYLGSVFRGLDQNLGRSVAVRILCNGIRWNAKIEELLDRGCRSIAELQHPNIAAVFEAGKEGQDHYIVMESLGSNSLESLIGQKATMSVESKLSIMIQVAEGLGYAHKKGILHRDLSPGKIHLTNDSKIKIRDFAITHVLMRHLPHPVVRWGAPIYMSPEQIQHKDCDERSDIFSAGMIFYELLTYFHPFHDPNGNKALDNILLDVQIPTFEQFPDAPPGIWPMLKTCLARDPNDRYGSMDELSSACRELLKSLAEDTQLMLAELYASLTPLRKAAARPHASEDTTGLLRDIERLSRGDKEADYASLDRMMTLLIEQYPSIQAATGEPDPIAPQPLPQGMKVSVAPEEGHVSLEASCETAVLPYKPLSSEIPAMSCPNPAVELPAIPPMPASGVSATEKRSESHETGLTKMGDLQPELQQFPIPPPVNQPSVLPADAGRKDAAAQPLQAVAQSPKIAEELPKQTGFTKIGDLQPELQQLPITPPVNQPSSVLPADTGPKDMAAQPLQAAAQSPEIAEELPKQTASTSRRRRILRAFYRTAAVLLSIVVIAAATYIALGTEGRNPVQNAWNLFLTNAHLRTNAPVLQNRSGPAGIPATATGLHKAQEALPRNSDAILLKIKEAQTLAAENRFAESRVLLNQILEINPNDQSALAALKEVEAKSGAANQGAADGQPAQELFSRISALIDTGKLQSAKTELDKLQRGYPADPEVLKLRRRWQAKNTKDIQEKARIEEEQQKAARRQKEDEWNRQVADLLTRGKYNEANGAWHLWITENPGSSRAQEFGAKIEEVQRGLREYAAALSENRYQDAINALRSVEKTNPGDPSLAELRRQVDVRKAAARAALTVHRLGARAVLLLDGQPIGNDGEVENEIIPIGNHTLAIENEGVTVASRSQEYSEGQRVALVYDMAKLNLRPMSEADRELLAHRKELEGVHRFETEHQHGILRGNCRGVLSIDFLDIAYKPSSGLHGFRMPLKLFKLRFEGRLVDLSNISDNKHFQTFRFPDQQTADRFIRVWGELKAMAR